jgi:hypothetical protein
LGTQNGSPARAMKVPTNPPTQSYTPAVFTKTIALEDDYVQGCEVFLDCGGTGHRSDGTVRAAAVTDAVEQVESVFPQRKKEAQYTKELEMCVESVIFDAAIANQPHGVIATYNPLNPNSQPLKPHS